MSAFTARPPQVLTTREVRIVRAIGQTLFPRDRNVDVDAIDAGVVAYIDDWLSRVGKTERAQFHALIQAFDAGYPIWAKNPGARLEAARPEERRAYLDSWERSAAYVQRQLWEGLRSMFLFAFVDAAPVLEAIGITSDGEAEASDHRASATSEAAETAAEPEPEVVGEQPARVAGGGCGARSLKEHG